MSYDPLENKLLEIETHLRELTPKERNRILDWIKNDKQRLHQIQKAVATLQRCLDTLRVLVKYTVFDLECTRRENVALQKQVAQLQQSLESHGHYAEEGIEQHLEPDAGDFMIQLPESGEDEMRAYHGTIDLPSLGDFIHSNECDHPYDTDCWCEHCEACRIRMQQYGSGANGAD